jgi:hypothetical protein
MSIIVSLPHKGRISRCCLLLAKIGGRTLFCPRAALRLVATREGAALNPDGSLNRNGASWLKDWTHWGHFLGVIRRLSTSGVGCRSFTSSPHLSTNNQ